MKQEKIKFVTLTYCNDNKTYVKADTIVQLSEIDGKTYVYTINDNVPIIVKERVDEIMAKLEEDRKMKCGRCKHKYSVKREYPCKVCSEQYASKFERE